MDTYDDARPDHNDDHQTGAGYPSLYVFTKQFERDFKRLASAIHSLNAYILKGLHDMAQIDDELTTLQTSVAANTDATASATALIGGIAQKIADAVAAALAAGATPTQLQAITDLQASVDANTAGLAAAVTAGTTTTPPPAPI